jgi:hypothetical protein
MSWLDRLLGRGEPENTDPQYRRTSPAQRSEDEIAVERYQYLLRTAPPETIEQVHQEAFAKLTEEQRDMLFQRLTETAPAGDQPRGRDAASLASSATRSELRQPGTMERAMGAQGGPGAQGGGMGFGGVLASSLLGTVAGYVIGSALVSSFLPDAGSEASADGGGDSADAGGDPADAGGDYGGGDFGGGDYGGGFGGGDFGGGDFGGGGDF